MPSLPAVGVLMFDVVSSDTLVRVLSYWLLYRRLT